MIRAKFRAHLVKSTPYSDSSPCEQVQLHAVYSDDPQSENYSWSQATPTGDLHLTITNPDAIGKFQEGAEYYLDITPVEVEAAVEAPASEPEADPEATPEPDQTPTAEVQEPLHESGSAAEAEAVPETSPPVPAVPEEPAATEPAATEPAAAEPAAEDTPDAESTAPASPQTYGTW